MPRFKDEGARDAARAREQGMADLKDCARPAFIAPSEVMSEIKRRNPGLDEKVVGAKDATKNFVKWYNTTASSDYAEYKTRRKI